MKYVPPYGVTDPNASYQNGDPSIGRPGSIPPAAVFENPQREIVNAITKAGLSPVDTDLYQLLKGVRTQFYNWAIDTGIVNYLACTFDPPLDAYNNGFVVRIKVRVTNTGPSQIDCGPGARPIVRIDGSPLAANDMVAGGISVMCYVDGEFQLLNPNAAAMIEAAVSGGGGGTSGGGVTYITNQYGAYQAIVAWMSPGTYSWTVPTGVTRCWFRLWAGGGGGENFAGDDWKVGGHGGYVEGLFPLVAGTPMQIVIGGGGPGGRTSTATTTGQPSSFGVTGAPVMCSASGGQSCYGSGVPSNGGPGAGTGGSINRANGVYGRGGGLGPGSAAATANPTTAAGDAGAGILMY